MFTVTNDDADTVLTTPDFMTAVEAAGMKHHIKGEMDYHNAVAFLKALRGYNWYIAVAPFAPKTTDPERGFTLYTNVNVTKGEAFRVIDNAYGTRFKAECNLRFSILGESVFVF